MYSIPDAWTYVPIEDATGTIVLIGRIRHDPYAAELIHRDDPVWRADERGYVERRYLDPGYDWMSETDALAIIDAWTA